VATNLLQWFDVFYPQKEKAKCTIEVANLWEKNFIMGQKLHWLKKKVRFAPWMEKDIKNLLAQIQS
jgi:hypothetical protein